MRIKRNNTPKMSIIGRVKVGEKTEKACKSLDYFRPMGKYEQRFKKVFGEKPSEIKIVIPDYNCLDVRYELRKGKKVVALSNGNDVFTYDKDGNKIEQQKPFKDLEDEYSKRAGNPWQEILRLDFWLPQTKVLGLWRFSTKGLKSSIGNIESFVNNMENMNAPINQMVCTLSVEMITSQILDKAKFPVVNISADLEDRKIKENILITDEKILIGE